MTIPLREPSASEATPSRESGARKIGQAVFTLLAFVGIGLDLIAIAAAAFPGSSGEWAGLGVAIPATLAVIAGLVMIPLIFTKPKGQRRKYVLLTAVVLLLPVVAVGVSRARSYLRQEFIYKPMVEKMAPTLQQHPTVQPAPTAPPPSYAPPPCIAENDPAYPLAVATMNLIGVRDRKQYWENRLQHDDQLRQQYVGGYDQMLAEVFAQYRVAGGTEATVSAVKLLSVPCQSHARGTQLPVAVPPPPVTVPQRSRESGGSVVSQSRSIPNPAAPPR